MTTSTFEVEQKYHVADLNDLEHRLRALGATEGPTQSHRDQYFNHPSRDFAETKEAFRVRRVDGIPMVTYKGAKLPGEIKARHELQWRLDPGDPKGLLMEELLALLGFRPVAVVEKRRRPFSLGGEMADFEIVIDDVASLGTFAEIELIASDPALIPQSRERIGQLGRQLGLHRSEPRSYLSMVLQLGGTQNIQSE